MPEDPFESVSGPRPRRAAGADSPEDRQRRLAEALRANLRRRKQQRRARATGEGSEEEPKTSGDAAEDT